MLPLATLSRLRLQGIAESCMLLDTCVRTKGTTTSSTKWLHRQKKDPLVRRAAVDQYRCRSAYKLIELDDKFRFLHRGAVVVDCGASPGAWSQVAAQRVGASKDCGGLVLAVDIQDIEGLDGVTVMTGSDITDPKVHERVREFLAGRRADVVMSDMALNASGIREMDHQRIIELARSAFSLSQTILKDGGVFVCKLWQGAHTNGFKSELNLKFDSVRECRLKSTRKESSEVFIYAQQFRLLYPIGL